MAKFTGSQPTADRNTGLNWIRVLQPGDLVKGVMYKIGLLTMVYIGTASNGSQYLMEIQAVEYEVEEA